ncbi:RecA regulator RecX [Streptococcus infantarius subsp. infantarius]|nr:RecA regulator RecX [Streptococcus infantarius subsp. infantarius]MCO4638409.1 RecA regulator RecX [Streptococcus infantarius subsp. infantarius]MCO4640977.1 RecA regulator RecX [Streptococcus infantarius subsp. infantarius]MCO4644568.1 RecA regulator RecX [Streptococcus infantarius subsp. infantarius]MCO4652374.1 RecA regulator RecX [Streptococcus infantarius subsp. infantarius]
MKITKIEKKKRLYLLEIDANDKLYVTEDTIVHFMLSKNMEIDEATLKDIQKFAQFSYGKNLALYHISFKQRTAAEVKKYLEQHDIDSLYIPEILENLKKENWINDEQYVETYLSQNLNTGDKGAYVLKQKLIQKGINSQLIDQKLAELDFSDLAEKTAQKLLRKYQNKLSTKTLKDKIIQNMMNKGFSYTEAKDVFETLDIEKDKQQEFELLNKELDKQYRKFSKKYEGYELNQRLTQALARKGFSYDDIKSALRDHL